MGKNTPQVCKSALYEWDGFSIQRGMIFGTLNGEKYVSNGLLTVRGTYYVYLPKVTIYGEIIWNKWEVKPNTPLFRVIESGTKRRERAGVELHYSTSAELEEVRWSRDERARHFQKHDPFGVRKVSGGKDPHAAVKYNAMKERNTMTQRVNTRIYIDGEVVTVI